jgi:hypothetical protein
LVAAQGYAVKNGAKIALRINRSRMSPPIKAPGFKTMVRRI